MVECRLLNLYWKQVTLRINLQVTKEWNLIGFATIPHENNFPANLETPRYKLVLIMWKCVECGFHKTLHPPKYSAEQHSLHKVISCYSHINFKLCLSVAGISETYGTEWLCLWFPPTTLKLFLVPSLGQHYGGKKRRSAEVAICHQRRRIGGTTTWNHIPARIASTLTFSPVRLRLPSFRTPESYSQKLACSGRSSADKGWFIGEISVWYTQHVNH